MTCSLITINHTRSLYHTVKKIPELLNTHPQTQLHTMSDSDICSDNENYGGIGAAMANSMHRRERRRERAYRARRRVMSKEEEEEENNEGRRGGDDDDRKKPAAAAAAASSMTRS